LIIINDGSKDKSLSIAKGFKDSRIKVYTQTNKGLAKTLNRGISLSKGTYLARQDQDDFSYPKRLEKQVNYLNKNPKCGLAGTWAEIWEGDNKNTHRNHKHPSTNKLLQFFLLFNNPFVHSSVMIRKKALKEVGLYSTDKSRQPPEDYELWSRIAQKYELANIPEILHAYLEIPSSMSRSKLGFKSKVAKISRENLRRALWSWR
ncbi:MAG: glycosyltransferase, partial [bacterium]